MGRRGVGGEERGWWGGEGLVGRRGVGGEERGWWEGEGLVGRRGVGEVVDKGCAIIEVCMYASCLLPRQLVTFFVRL